MFRGTATAIITPFTDDGRVDEEALRRLVEFQEDNGVKTIAPCGSTGESAMLTPGEHIRVIEIVMDSVRKAKVLAGAGSNCTSEAISLSKFASDMGVDGILSISPYYVKPTQEGIFQHYEAIANAIGVPLVVYNIPGRTGSNVSADTLLRLAEIDNIVAVKEASGNMDQIKQILDQRPKGFEVLSGDDSLTCKLIEMGGDGVVSVTSNCFPKLMSDMVENMLMGKKSEAEAIDKKLAPLFKGLFIESNPIPIQYTMMKMGYGNGIPRLPLTPISEKGKRELDPILSAFGI